MDIQKIHTLNPWFSDKTFTFKESNLKKRLIYKKLKKSLDLKKIISLSGLRRIGKTTLIKQLAQKLLDTKKEIYYYQFSQQDNNLKEILEFFVSKKIKNVYTSKVYIFLDELQYVDNWQETLKYYYDLNKDIQFIITGSANLYPNKKIKESLAGRQIDLSLKPLSFDEYLYFKHDYKPKTKIDFSSSPKEIISNIKKRSQELKPYKNEIWEFLIQGEFLETINYTDYAQIKQYFKESVTNKILAHDVSIFEILKNEEIAFLYKLLLQNSAQFFSASRISSDVGISLPTIKKYTSILSKSFLVNLLKNDLRSIRSQKKSFDKIFSASINLMCANLSISSVSDLSFTDFKGHIIENYVFNQINKIYKDIDEVLFYNKNEKEIDFILKTGSKTLPIEVKSGKKYKKTHSNHLVHYAQKNNISDVVIFYSGEEHVVEKDGVKIHLVSWI